MERLEEWHQVFTWFPIYCEQEEHYVWLEPVWRRRDLRYYGCYFEYKISNEEQYD